MSSSTVWAGVSVALLLVGVAPGLYLSLRGSNVQRLVGLQLLASSGVLVLVGLIVLVGQSSYLIVPLVLAMLASTGTLVYTRLLSPGMDDPAIAGPDDDGDEDSETGDRS